MKKKAVIYMLICAYASSLMTGCGLPDKVESTYSDYKTNVSSFMNDNFYNTEKFSKDANSSLDPDTDTKSSETTVESDAEPTESSNTSGSAAESSIVSASETDSSDNTDNTGKITDKKSILDYMLDKNLGRKITEDECKEIENVFGGDYSNVDPELKVQLDQLEEQTKRAKELEDSVSSTKNSDEGTIDKIRDVISFFIEGKSVFNSYQNISDKINTIDKSKFTISDYAYTALILSRCYAIMEH